MKRVLCSLFLILFSATSVFAVEGKLPDPQTNGGPTVLTAIDERASATGKNFPTGAISDKDLGTILWAATGRNRQNKGWTVPMAMGKAPYCTVYVAGEDGAYRYEWKDHSLRKITSENIKKIVGMQGFVGQAPYVLIFVIDTEAAEKHGAGTGEILIGAMTQNTYLAGQALGIGTRYIASIESDTISTKLLLKDSEKPLCVLPIGHFE